jgi:ABC-2 type transport system ATP-binding protein
MLVDIHDVHRSYGPVHALRGVTLQLPPGVIGLVGNNGAGKSTLLKVLLGLLRPDSGGGTILGYDILTSASQLRGRVGYMSEAAGTVPVLRGAEFVTLSGELYGMPRRQAARRAHEVLYYCGLGELRYRPLEEYSAGNRQRLKLAAALVHDPELLLLDEPTSGLDPAGRAGFLDLLSDLIAETKKSILLSTHLLGDIERLCDQVVMIERGQVVSAGTMAALREQIENRYELRWHGADEPFLERLASSGLEVKSGPTTGRAVVTVPIGMAHREGEAVWSTAALFALAREAGVVLTGLKLDEEDLERTFFRVTDAKRRAP